MVFIYFSLSNVKVIKIRKNQDAVNPTRCKDVTNESALFFVHGR